MTRSGLLRMALAFAVTLTSAPAGAQDTQQARDARIEAELRSQSPEAESLYVAGTAAYVHSDFSSSLVLMRRAGQTLPGNAHIMRGEGLTLLALGQRDSALDLIRGALARAHTADNLAALAYALLRTPPGVTPVPADLHLAASYCDEAIALDPTYAWHRILRCEIALMEGNVEALRTQVKTLRSIAPDSLATHVFAAIAEAVDGRPKRAKDELEAAHRLGLSDSLYRSQSEMIARIQPPPAVRARRVAELGGLIIGVWLGLMAVLLLAGIALSAATMRNITRIPTSTQGRATGLDAFLRRLYGAVLWLTCGYYYVSIPLVTLLVVALAGGLIYTFLVIGHVPIKLFAIVAVFGFGTLLAIARSLFIRVKDQEPGLKLNLEAHSRLRRVLDQVAERIGTRPVDNVYMTPGTEVAVLERGGMLGQLRGTSERCLILGAGVLDGMQLGPFRAVLGHEYGHFSNRDTAGGGFALGVRRSLVTMALHIARSGAAAWYNPAWLFLLGFHRVFLRISQGASRLQEILADRWASFRYGAAAFEAGLLHVIEASARFEPRMNATLREVIEGKLPLANLYAFRPTTGPSEAEIQQAVEAVLAAKPSPYDSHPRPADRFAMVHALPAEDLERSTDDEDAVWSLFPDREEIERSLTELVRTSIRANHGIEIPVSA